MRARVTKAIAVASPIVTKAALFICALVFLALAGGNIISNFAQLHWG